MSSQRYVALLRGINVGGRNLIAMAALREAFEADGHRAVSTYIQSGNVLFESEAPRQSLEARIETMLEARLGKAITVVVRSRPQLRAVVDKAPPGFGEEPAKYHSDVLFLKPSLSSRQVMRTVQLQDEVDQLWAGTGVVYFARLSERLAESRISKFVSTPEYQLVTMRSWTTTVRLRDLITG